MTLDGVHQMRAETTENMGTVEKVTYKPTNTCRTEQGANATTSLTDTDTEISTTEQQIPPVYQATHYGRTLREP